MSAFFLILKSTWKRFQRFSGNFGGEVFLFEKIKALFLIVGQGIGMIERAGVEPDSALIWLKAVMDCVLE